MGRQTKNKGSYIGRNIHAIRVANNLSQEQLAAIAGVSQTAVSSWECGQSVPRRSNVAKIIAKIPGLDLDDVFSKESGYVTRTLRESGKSDEPAFSEIPLYSSYNVADGRENSPIEATFSLPRAVGDKYPNSFFLPMEDDSMNRCLPKGCNALVYPTSEAVEGQVHAICIGDADAMIRRVHLLNNGMELQPDSTDPTYKSEVFDFSDEETEPVTVVGRVVWYGIPLDFEI